MNDYEERISKLDKAFTDMMSMAKLIYDYSMKAGFSRDQALSIATAYILKTIHAL